MKKIFGNLFVLAGVILLAIFLNSCKKEGENLLSEYIVTAQIAKSPVDTAGLNTYICSGSVILGKIELKEEDLSNVSKLLTYIPENPEPNDSNIKFPDIINPVSGAQITVSSKSDSFNIKERIDGIYFSLLPELNSLEEYTLKILTEDKELKSSVILPDTFSIKTINNEILPESLNFSDFDSLEITWSKSEQAEKYIVKIEPPENAGIETFKKTVEDTFVKIFKDEIFKDTLGNYIEGLYKISIWAINGMYKKGDIQFILSRGNVDGATGIFCAITCSKSLKVYFKKEDRK